jgi:hypothetical protein
MRFAIDVLFLDADDRVVAACEGLAPWRLSRVFPEAEAALELPAGCVRATGTVIGHHVGIGMDVG